MKPHVGKIGVRQHKRPRGCWGLECHWEEGGHRPARRWTTTPCPQQHPDKPLATRNTPMNSLPPRTPQQTSCPQEYPKELPISKNTPTNPSPPRTPQTPHPNKPLILKNTLKPSPPRTPQKTPHPRTPQQIPCRQEHPLACLTPRNTLRNSPSPATPPRQILQLPVVPVWRNRPTKAAVWVPAAPGTGCRRVRGLQLPAGYSLSRALALPVPQQPRFPLTGCLHPRCKAGNNSGLFYGNF